jgi:exo-1,4-beta-D-glucosaminidase
MLNNAWPGLIWHLYSYDLRAAGGYFGSKKALELIHVQFNHDDRMVAIVNGTQSAQNGLKVVAKVYDLAMNEKFSSDAKVDVDADGIARAFAIPEPADISSTYFLNLQLISASGQLLSRNFYWLSTKSDVLNFEKTEWYYTPQTAFADFSALQKLEPASVKLTLKPGSTTPQDAEYRATIENAGKGLAFLVHLRVMKPKGGAEILPAYWDDNYISLLPGERREVQVRVRKSDLGSAQPDLIVDGFNLAPQTIHISH